ncbi:hypothetical protein B0H12DRAFT_333810 [Mycena haematopus]|nr:hypothetical protein B0H12DRAFT_333810 [Mycena haematopus]
MFSCIFRQQSSSVPRFLEFPVLTGYTAILCSCASKCYLQRPNPFQLGALERPLLMNAVQFARYFSDLFTKFPCSPFLLFKFVAVVHKQSRYAVRWYIVRVSI